MMMLIHWLFCPFRALPVHLLLWVKRAARVESPVFHIVTHGPLASQLLVGAWVDDKVLPRILHLMTGDFQQHQVLLRDLWPNRSPPAPNFTALSIVDFGDGLRCGLVKYDTEELLRWSAAHEKKRQNVEKELHEHL